jgi:hypothetical protein
MASGVTFWQMPDEEEVFFRYLLSKGDIDAFSFLFPARDPSDLRSSPLEAFLGRTDDTRLYLTLHEYAVQPPIIEFQRQTLDDGPRYTFGVEFPSIMYSRGLVNHSQLSQSNASARTCYPDKAVTVVHKMPEPFLRWVKATMSWLRRATPEWHEYRGYRATKRAAQAALGGLKLVPYHGWSGNSTGESSFMPIEQLKGTS